MIKGICVLVIILGGVSATPPPEKCERTWKKVGCFHDRIIPDRPLPNEILNHRDSISKIWDGHLIDWKAWPESLHALTCKCAELTKERGHRYFGLQFFGECWTGPNSERYYRDGASDKCIGVDYQPCDDETDTECVGKAFTNYIYDTQGKEKTPIPGGWTDWTNWTPCSKKCGGGEHARERSCTNPKPENGGSKCEGEELEEAKCNPEACEPICKSKLEIGVITDASSSVTAINYKKMKQFVANLTDEFDVGATGVHFGMIHYSWSANLDFTMKDEKYWDSGKLKEKILASRYIYGGTRTDLALYKAEKEFFCDRCVRADVPKILIVITDGKSSITADPMSKATKGLKEKGVTIISLGIGNRIDKKELLQIAKNEQHRFVIDDFDNLVDKLNAILKLSCRASKYQGGAALADIEEK